MDEERDKFINIPGTPGLVARDTLPPALANTLDHIVGQLNLIGRTMAILDQRLTLTENRISSLAAASRGLTPMMPDEIHAGGGGHDIEAGGAESDGDDYDL